MSRSQHVRFCTQCEELLPTKCPKCVAHPNRRPRVIAIYDAPPILATAPCGCVKIQCQYKGCRGPGFMWRRLKSDGSLAQHNHYCTNACSRADLAEGRKTRVKVTCSYPPCGVVFERKSCEVKRARLNFHSPKCGYLNRRLETQKRKDAKEDTSVGMLDCSRCRQITEHETPLKGRARCKDCGHERGQGTAPSSPRETQSLVIASKSIAAISGD